MGKLVITIGETLEAANERLFESVRRAKAGETVDADTHINFSNPRTMLNALNLKRYEILAYLVEHRPKTVQTLADGLGRRYRRVHDDVQYLIELGLVDRQVDGSLGVGHDPTISAKSHGDLRGSEDAEVEAEAESEAAA